MQPLWHLHCVLIKYAKSTHTQSILVCSEIGIAFDVRSRGVRLHQQKCIKQITHQTVQPIQFRYCVGGEIFF